MIARVRAKLLAEALRFVSKAVPTKAAVPVHGDVRLEIVGETMNVSAGDGVAVRAAEIPLIESEPGVVIVPAKRLADLASKFTPDAEARLKDEVSHVSVRCGSGRWKLPERPSGDWPVVRSPGAQAANFTFPQVEARRISARLTHLIGDDPLRIYLHGVCLHRADGRLACVATDGNALARIVIDLDPGEIGAPILPLPVVEALDEMARTGDVTVRIDESKIELRGGSRALVSSLIAAKFPKYGAVLPSPSENQIEVSAAALTASIERHSAISNDVGIGLSWSDGVFATCASRNEDAATEQVEATVTGKGRFAAADHYLLDALHALAADRVVIDHGGPNAPVRITNPAEPDTIMIVMPMSWLSPINNQSQPAPRTRRGR